MTTPDVSGDEWLTAIDADPEMFDTELVVATAIVAGDGTIGLEPLDGINVQDAIEELIAMNT